MSLLVRALFFLGVYFLFFLCVMDLLCFFVLCITLEKTYFVSQALASSTLMNYSDFIYYYSLVLGTSRIKWKEFYFTCRLELTYILVNTILFGKVSESKVSVKAVFSSRHLQL